MKKIFLLLLVSFIAATNLRAQKIIPIEHNGIKYEVLDMTSAGKVMWGGYGDEIAADAAKSETEPPIPKQSSLLLVKTPGLKGSRMLLSCAAKQQTVARTIGTCLPKMSRMLFMLLKINLM